MSEQNESHHRPYIQQTQKGTAKKVINQIKKTKSSRDVFQIKKQNVRQTQSNFQILKLSQISCALLAVLSFTFSSITYDITYPAGAPSQKQMVVNISYGICSVSTLLLLISIFWRTQREFLWQQSKGIYAQHYNLISSGKYIQFSIEIVLNAIHPLWFIQEETFQYYNSVTDVTVEYTYNSMLVVITIFRSYHIIRVISILTNFRSSRAQRVCSMNGTYAGTWFALKCIMKDKPLFVVNFLMLLGILIGGYLMRIFQRPLSEAAGLDYFDYGNTMWLAILTMTTVGYGYYFPVTLFGRIFGFIVCLWGVVVVSLMVVTLSNMLELESGENNALLLFKRLNFKEELREIAAHVITSAFRFKLTVKKDPTNIKDIMIQLGNLKMNLNKFQSLKLQQRSLYDLDSSNDRIERKINYLVDNTEDTIQFIQRMQTRLQGIYERRQDFMLDSQII